MTSRAQKVLIWWGIAGFIVWGLSELSLQHMLPPGNPAWSPAQIGQFYLKHSFEIRAGAVVNGVTGGCLLPLMAAIAIQMFRHERQQSTIPGWSLLGTTAGAMTTMWVALPPLLFGAAAYSVREGVPDGTIAAIHHVGALALVSTEQFVNILFICIAVLCFTPNSVHHSPFSRWFGYFNVMVLIASECGNLCFLANRGLIAWNGFLPFWNALLWILAWLIVTPVVLIRAINAQKAASGHSVLQQPSMT
jgi:hypothetical protein